ncbi:MAG TPA: universal stress protein [Bacteroidota bacterium]
MYRLDRILCPIDFSTPSQYAARYAAFLAESERGTVTLIYVDEHEKDPLGLLHHVDQDVSEYRASVGAVAQKKFSEFIAAANLNPNSFEFLVRFGTAYREIIDEAEAKRYAAVVVATEGSGHSSPHLIGRTVERVVRLCRAPVITARPIPSSNAWNVRTILCPTDFSEYSNYAIPYAVSVARHYRARIILLHVADLTVQNPELLAQKFPELKLYHEQADEIAVEKLVGRDVDPENTIVRLAEEYNVDLIVMGTHGARGMRRVQIGNVVEEVVRRTAAPVLTITHPIHKTVFPLRFVDDYEKHSG